VAFFFERYIWFASLAITAGVVPVSSQKYFFWVVPGLHVKCIRNVPRRFYWTVQNGQPRSLYPTLRQTLLSTTVLVSLSMVHGTWTCISTYSDFKQVVLTDWHDLLFHEYNYFVIQTKRSSQVSESVVKSFWRFCLQNLFDF